MKRRYLLPVLMAFLLWAPSVWAQCNGGNLPGCRPAVDPQPTDILLGYQYGQNPHTRAFSVQQLANTTAGTFTNLAVSGNGSIGGTFTAGASTLTALTVPGGASFTSLIPGSFVVDGPVNLGSTLTAGATTVQSLSSGNLSASQLTTTGNASVGGTLGVTGITTFSAAYIPKSVTIATLPAAPSAGSHVWVTDCLNGSESGGSGTGCDYRANDSGSWIANPSPPTGTITIGSAPAIRLGGSIAGLGNGSRVQMACVASPVSGNVPQFDATGCLVDSGSGPGGGGGSGSVSSGLANQIGFYSAAGTNITGLPIVNNGVPSYSGAGLLSVSTTLPGSLTIPSPSVSNLNATGTTSMSALNMSGKLSFAASTTVTAPLTIPAGTAPTTPNNGDVWTTTAGLFVRANGTTVGPVVGLAQQSALAPLVYNNATGVESCPTCALTTNGGQLSATVPMAISAAGLITCLTCATTTNGGPLSASAPLSISANGGLSLGETQRYAELVWDSQTSVHNDTYPIVIKMPSSGGGHIQSVTYYTSGTNSPAFTLSLQVNGVNVGSCNGLIVGTGGNGVGVTTTTTCTSTAVTQNQRVDAVITGTAGTPSSAAIQVNYTMAPT